VALAAVALGPMVAAVIVLRGAREGLRAFAGADAGLRAFGVALWLASLMVVLSILGVSLASRHHHALIGVTYAFAALVAAVGSAVVCARVVAILRDAPAWARVTLVVLLGLLALGALALLAYRLARAASLDAESAAAAGTVVDVLAFALAALLAASRWLELRRVLALLGPPLAVAVVALGISALRDARVRDAVDEYAPAFAPAAHLVSRR
jgi:hypothetical protein